MLGAQRLGRLDLAQPGMDFLMRHHDPDSGGFYSSDTQRGPDVKQDLMVPGFCGLAALAAGRSDAAIGVGGWLQRLLEAQPRSRPRGFSVPP